ncbi:hypothetical protein FRB96_006686 [Tulasnella sp. 330]|nr:hypothetical protein FRB96_006686 [Tulasnella sp. 330]KAG8883255.1 hypothetical protein FRB97_006950 [Tulasnella sp. 331]
MLGNGVDSLTLELVQPYFDSDTNASKYHSAGSFSTDVATIAMNYPSSALTLYNGEWRVRADYSSIYEKGVEGQRNNVISQSEPFFMGEVNAKRECVGVAGRLHRGDDAAGEGDNGLHNKGVSSRIRFWSGVVYQARVVDMFVSHESL